MWPFKHNIKPEIVKYADDFHLEFIDEDGVRWLFDPHIRITAYESALLLPVFFFTPYPVNRWPYIRKHNLTKHFKRKENEVGIQK